MAKNKLNRFKENAEFEHLFQPVFKDVFNKDFHLKANWNKELFKNDNLIILELACGKGEYTVGLAEKYPNKNFIGIDIKGARLWQGAKIAYANELNNVAFTYSKLCLPSHFVKCRHHYRHQ